MPFRSILIMQQRGFTITVNLIKLDNMFNLSYAISDLEFSLTLEPNVTGCSRVPWKVLGPGDDNSESFNTLKVYCP